MILKEALEKAIDILKKANIDAPAIEAGVILCHVIGKDKVFLYSHPECILKDETLFKFFRYIGRRAERVPLQYIIGHQEFMSIDFIVNPNVLIPRHDTETLVEAIINYAMQLKVNSIDILDIGTGSGCIAISLAKFIQSSSIIALDISEEALETAKLNAINAGVEGKVTFLKVDIFEMLNRYQKEVTKFDIIVSNPPYISALDMITLQREVKDFEPISALFGGEDGLDFYREIINNGDKFLKASGLLAFEVGYDQAYEVANLMAKKYGNIKIEKDLANIDRVVYGVLV